MSQLGVSFEALQEADLQPVLDLVNWVLMTPYFPKFPTEKAPVKQPGKIGIRKERVYKLINTMSDQEGDWSLPDSIHAVIAALLTLYEQPLVLMELHKVIKAVGS